jgi:small subunit ribosomal protein S16
MVVIRLARGGAKKRPFFTIVATDSRNARDGRFVERVGFYNPKATETETRFRIAEDRLAHWRSVGAQVSPTVARLVKTLGVSAAGQVAQATPAPGGPTAAPTAAATPEAPTAAPTAAATPEVPTAAPTAAATPEAPTAASTAAATPEAVSGTEPPVAGGAEAA